MWNNNNVGLHTFISGAKSNPKITSKLKGAKLVTLKMWATKMFNHLSIKNKIQHEFKN
jgi:hypothetical protein